MDSILAQSEPAGTEAAAAEASAPPAADQASDAEPGTGRQVHRLRDLDRSGRFAALLLGVGLVVAPVVALIHYLPHWVPSQDPAMMALRALDVGTSRTPMIGQPSLAHLYQEGNTVHHLGATHFYLLAPFVRIFGAQTGMLLVSVLITGSCLLIMAWAVFRQLGPRAGVIAAVILGAITYTTGMASLINPVSSNMAGYPLFCSAVLLWCLMCGDLRLLPLTTVLVTFTAQQHLSVLPTIAILAAAGVVGLVMAVRWGPSVDRPARQEVARWVGLSAGLAAVLWLPVLLQQLFGNVPNLTRLAKFSGDHERPSLGFAASARQVAHVLGLPPVLGQSNINAHWLNEPVSVPTGLTAAAVVAITVVAALRWRRSRPRQALLVVMAAVVAVAGLVNGASVPTGTYETYRLAFYHWIFPLTFLVTLVLALVVVELFELVRHRQQATESAASTRAPSIRLAVVGIALVVIVVPSLVNVTQDRWLNSLPAAFSPIDRSTVDEITDQVMAHEDELEGPVLLVARGQSRYWGFHQALALALEERGFRVRQPGYEAMFVAEGRWAHRATVQTGLVMMVDGWTNDDLNVLDLPEGAETIADVEIPAAFEREAFAVLGQDAYRPRRIRVFRLDREDLLGWVTEEELLD